MRHYALIKLASMDEKNGFTNKRFGFLFRSVY